MTQRELEIKVLANLDNGDTEALKELFKFTIDNKMMLTYLPNKVVSQVEWNKLFLEALNNK